MKIFLIAVGKKVPSWVNEGYKEYAKRLSQDCTLELIEVESGKRSKKYSASETKAEDAKNILKALPDDSFVVVLDESGKEFSTRTLAKKLDSMMLSGKNIALLVGGADGLDSSVKEIANEIWSLSQLTLPHPLVRVLIAEQIYRAWSLLKNHPYHRE